MSCTVVSDEVNGLRVTFGDVEGAPFENDDCGPAYRVQHAKSQMALPLKFGRKRDAEAAMRAIAGMADWTQDAESVARYVEFDEVRQRMVEAMAW